MNVSKTMKEKSKSSKERSRIYISLNKLSLSRTTYFGIHWETVMKKLDSNITICINGTELTTIRLVKKKNSKTVSLKRSRRYRNLKDSFFPTEIKIRLCTILRQSKLWHNNSHKLLLAIRPCRTSPKIWVSHLRTSRSSTLQLSRIPLNNILISLELKLDINLRQKTVNTLLDLVFLPTARQLRQMPTKTSHSKSLSDSLAETAAHSS